MPDTSKAYGFSDIVYFSGTRTLVFESGRKEQLSPIAGKVFILLLENVGTSVTKEELFSSCWGNAVVSDQSLTNVVSNLRKTLKLSVKGGAQIKTISKVGYILNIDGDISVSIDMDDSGSFSLSTESVGIESQTGKPLYHDNSIELEDLALSKESGATYYGKSLPNKSISKTFIAMLVIVAVTFTWMTFFVISKIETSVSQLPYFIDVEEYALSHRIGDVTVFANSESALEAASAFLEGDGNKIIDNCHLTFYLRRYSSIDRPSLNALNIFIVNQRNQTLNYVVSKFEHSTSWIPLKNLLSSDNLFCR
ncbi:invasion protein regulator [Grimontia celer]|uniref:Invasion protein regulator n=1 Tax=Grimontia celer TaxID=1796497 RepID=A0A128F9V3_9GAMM|nr:winged helix-turn-helix domain-containing protein [Grimontia celer]CZF83061.1 invasion protein regulator [Grimontia celer]